MKPSEFFGNDKQEKPIYRPWANPMKIDATSVVANKPLPTYDPIPLKDYGKIEEGPGISLLDKFNRQPIVELAQKAFDSPFTQLPMIAVGAVDLLRRLPLTKMAMKELKGFGNQLLERQGSNISSLGNRVLRMEEKFGLPTNKLGTKLIEYGDDASARLHGYANYDDFLREQQEMSLYDVAREEGRLNQLESTIEGFEEEFIGDVWGTKTTIPAKNLQEATNSAWKNPDKLYSVGDFRVGSNSGEQYITRMSGPNNFFGYHYEPESNTVSHLSFSAESGTPFLRHIDELLPSKSKLDLEELSLSGDSSPILAKLVKWAEKHPEKYKVSSEDVLVPFNDLGKHTELSRLMRENPELAYTKAQQLGLKPKMGDYDPDPESLDNMIGPVGSSARTRYAETYAEEDALMRRELFGEDYPGGFVPPEGPKKMIGSYFPTYIQKLFGIGGFGLSANYWNNNQ